MRFIISLAVILSAVAGAGLPAVTHAIDNPDMAPSPISDLAIEDPDILVASPVNEVGVDNPEIAPQVAPAPVSRVQPGCQRSVVAYPREGFCQVVPE